MSLDEYKKVKKKCGHEIGYKCCCNSYKRDLVENPIDTTEEMNRSRSRFKWR